MKRIINCETNEIINRPFNEKELEQQKIDEALYAAKIAEEQAKEAARSALLARLGITEEEARLLLG